MVGMCSVRAEWRNRVACGALMKSQGSPAQSSPMSTAEYKRQNDRNRLLMDLQRLNYDRIVASQTLDLIPPDWHTLAWDIEANEKKQKVTLYIDQSVIEFFRAMCSGYQTRINRLLGSYMRLQMQNHLKLEEAIKKRVIEDDENSMGTKMNF